jgi:hypothetical protein
VPSLYRPVWYPGLGTTLCCLPSPPVLTCGLCGCDFRAMLSLSSPLSLCPVPWSGKHPLRAFPSGPHDPMFSLVVRAAAANVKPRTRLSHVTKIPPLLGSSLVHPRTMPSRDAKIPEFPADDSQDFATGSRIPRESRTTPRARAHYSHPHH